MHLHVIYLWSRGKVKEKIFQKVHYIPKGFLVDLRPTCGYKYGRLSSAYLFSFQAHDGAGASGITAKQVRTHGTLCKFAGVRHVKYQRDTKVTKSNAIYQVT